MRLYTILLLLLLSTTQHVHGQLILWSAERPLTWSDFQGNKPHKARARLAATTSSFILYRATRRRDSIITVVSAMFNTERSWKWRNDPGPYILRHEQSHFDIAELYARKLRMQIAAYRQQHTGDELSQKQLRHLYRSNNVSLKHYQHLYDRRTKHSRRPEQQERWNTDIARQLEALRAYEN